MNETRDPPWLVHARTNDVGLPMNEISARTDDVGVRMNDVDGSPRLLGASVPRVDVPTASPR
jgi:hypothetical protein